MVACKHQVYILLNVNEKVCPFETVHILHTGRFGEQFCHGGLCPQKFVDIFHSELRNQYQSIGH